MELSTKITPQRISLGGKILSIAVLALSVVLGLVLGIAAMCYPGLLFRSQAAAWEQLPAMPGQPVAITRISYDNYYVATAGHQIFRCTYMAEDCWSSDLVPMIPLNGEYAAQLEDGSPVPIPEGHLLPCDYSRPYFATVSFWIGSIKDCATSQEELYGEDWEMITILVIDAESNIWVYHDDSISAWVDSIDYRLPSPIVRLAIPVLSGLLTGSILAGIILLAGRFVRMRSDPILS